MSRDDLLSINLKIIRNVAENVKKQRPDAFVIVISNPLDAMVYEMKKVTGFPRSKVLGMAGALDSARFQCFLRRGAACSVKDVQRDGARRPRRHMVPCLSYTHDQRRAGHAAASPKDKLDAMVKRTRRRRRRDRAADGHERVLRAGRRRDLDGRELPQGAAPHDRVRRVPRGRVRLQGPVHRRAGRDRRRAASRRSSRSSSTPKRRPMLDKQRRRPCAS